MEVEEEQQQQQQPQQQQVRRQITQSDFRIYYSEFFPFDLVYRWLAYNDVSIFERREFACNIQVDRDSSVFVRYLSFSSPEDMRKTFSEKVPMRIEIGAIFSSPPKYHAEAVSFSAVERELIFDIDMDAYDEVRTCCKGANVCDKCWPLLNMAVKIMDTVLRECFGFNQLLWVFSGRRGIHCWVTDERARKLTSDARGAIIDFLTLVRGGGGSLGEKVRNVRYPLYPVIQRLVDNELKSFFENVFIRTQGVLATEKSIEDVLSFIPEDYTEDFRAAWARCGGPMERWDVLKTFVKEKKGAIGVSNIVTNIVLGYVYPRFDAAVTTTINHLLKSPFCVHPDSGKISVVIDPHNLEAFNPKDVPTIHQIIDSAISGNKRNNPLQHTIDIFEKYLNDSGLLAPVAKKDK